MKKEKSFNTKSIKKTTAIATVFVLATAGGFAYSTPTSYVSLDVNPSVEYSLNMFDRVLSVQAVNEDGEKIVAELDVKNLVISNAVQKTIDELLEKGFISDSEDAGVVITVSNKDEEKSEELAENIEIEAQEFLTENNKAADVEAEAVGKARVEEARKLGVTPGKLNLVEKLAASYGDTKKIGKSDITAWLDMSVQEINKTIKENRKALAETKAAGDVISEVESTQSEDDLKDKDEKSIKEKQQNENKPNKENKGLNKTDIADDSDDDEDLDEESDNADENDDSEEDNNSDSPRSENAKNKN